MRDIKSTCFLVKRNAEFLSYTGSSQIRKSAFRQCVKSFERKRTFLTFGKHIVIPRKTLVLCDACLCTGMLKYVSRKRREENKAIFPVVPIGLDVFCPCKMYTKPSADGMGLIPTHNSQHSKKRALCTVLPLIQ